MRIDGRTSDQIRKVTLTPNFNRYAEGSCLVEFGNTKVLCTASQEEKLPKWLQDAGKGWVGSEYGMLPRSTHTRINREKATNSGRSQEISRLIGRSLRAVVDLQAMKNVSLMVDCDVLQADGGTRTAAITGGFVALALALENLRQKGVLTTLPLKDYVSAVSVGVHGDHALLDLCYEEDSKIETDMNFVIAGSGNFVEIQGTAEGAPFDQKHLDKMIGLAKHGCKHLFEAQSQIVGSFFQKR